MAEIAVGGRSGQPPGAWAIGRPTLYGGPVMLRPVKATPCLMSSNRNSCSEVTRVSRAALRIVRARVLCQMRAPYRPITRLPPPPIAGPQHCGPGCCSTPSTPLNAALRVSRVMPLSVMGSSNYSPPCKAYYCVITTHMESCHDASVGQRHDTKPRQRAPAGMQSLRRPAAV